MNESEYEEFTLAEFNKNLQIGKSSHTVTVKLVRVYDNDRVSYRLEDNRGGDAEFEEEGEAKTEFMQRANRYIGLPG